MADDLHLGQIIATNNLYKELIGGKFGIELEAHRVSKTGRLSRIDHSAKLGSRRMHPYLQTDYSETQAELVTEPVNSFEAARDRLLQLQWVLRHHMTDDESIWPLSMPPELKQDDLQWLDEKFERTWMQDYRNWLMHKYGSTHEIMTGLHLNYSLPQDLLQHLFKASDAVDFNVFKDQVYFHLGQQIVAHQWLFNYLFGATPFNLNDTDSRTPQFSQPVRSLRTSEYGFVNDHGEKLAYVGDYEKYKQQIEKLLAEGKLFSEHEIYGPVRFKKIAADNPSVDYLEIRLVDTNPFDIAGISENELNLIHLLLIYFVINDEQLRDEVLQGQAETANEVSLQKPTDALPNKDAVLVIMQEISRLADHFGMRFNDGLSLITDRVLTPSKTPAAKMLAVAPNAATMQTWATQLGNDRARYFKENEQVLFADYFGTSPLSDVVKDALTVGVRVVEYDGNQIMLSVGDHVERVSEPVNINELFPELVSTNFK